jgi:response regulator RpfG family c-di-GMP phosphodiesterase
MATSILVVDDEKDLVNVFSHILKGAGYAVDTASDGEAAIKMLTTSPYSMVLSDLKMPKVTGIELLTWIRQKKKDTRVILMTGLAQLSDLQFEGGISCDGILPKPVTKDELLKVVNSVLTSGANAELAWDETRYGRVPIEDFICGKSIAYSIYARFKDGKFMKIANMGDDLDLGLIQSLKDQDINELWLEQEDFKHYMEFSQRIAQLAALRSEFTEDKRVYLIKNACETAYENLRLAGVSEQSMQAGQKIFEVSLRMLGTDSGATALLEMLENGGVSTFSHGTVTGLLCSMMAKVMGWSSQRNIINLTLGGFLHDIGLAELPAEVREKPFDSMTPEEKNQYMKHPQLGADKLKRFPKASRELVTIVLQHHENPRGTGYPHKLTRSDIFPMAGIVSVVERFADALLGQDKANRRKPAELFEEMVADDPYSFDAHATMALTLVLTQNNMENAKAAYLAASQKMSSN